MFAKKTEIQTPSEFQDLRSHLNGNIYFLQVWRHGGGEEKTRTEGQKGEEGREGEKGRKGKEEGKRRKEGGWVDPSEAASILSIF